MVFVTFNWEGSSAYTQLFLCYLLGAAGESTFYFHENGIHFEPLSPLIEKKKLRGI